MSHTKKNGPSGVITVHAPFPASLLKSEEGVTDVKHTSESRKSRSQQRERTGSTCRSVTPGERNEASPYVPEWATKQNWLSYTSLRQLQAQLKAEKQQAKEMLQPLQDAENGFMKEFEFFLSQHDVAELRRRELLHKHWTQHVWLPLQQRVEEHVSSCRPAQAKRRLSLYNQYLHLCNTKGVVFLETYDPKEYDPLLLNIKMQQDPLHHINERPTGRGIHSSSRSGYRHTRTKAEHPTTSRRALSESVESQASKHLQASSKYAASASINRPAVVETEQTKSCRPSIIPLHIRATATSDGWCHQPRCWFSRCGGLHQPAS